MEVAKEQHEWEQSKTMERDIERRELAKLKWSGKEHLKTKRQNQEQGKRRQKRLKHKVLIKGGLGAALPQGGKPIEVGEREEEKE